MGTHEQPNSVLDDPREIGPYKLLDILGEGGMGTVWLAEQTTPVNRRVALKIIKLGMDTREVVARFEAERQALAVMDHPNIAKVYDGGATSSGRPYFVMELVHGVPITEYCDRHRLSVSDRVRLFTAVCRAIQHAHLKGVVHRDLKPANVLVSVADSGPVVKVIDFGIAKAIGYRLTERTLVTLQGYTLGTPEYMSPEQAEGSGLDVDSRTDIYSLGVILFELLVGALPIESSAARASAAYAIRETEIPRPSTKFAQLGTSKARIASDRSTTQHVLRRQLSDDLDWIILKSMEKDRTRRYETANGLALDLERHLSKQPVLARPPSVRYRMKKFAIRNRVGVIAGGIALLAVLGGALTASIGFVRSARAERRAQQEAAAAKQVTAFLVDLFNVSDPYQSSGADLTARELLQRGSERVKTELASQPLVQARLLYTLGTVHGGLGLFDPARALLGDALRIRERLLGTRDTMVAETLEALGGVERDKGNFAQADVAYSRALVIRQAAGGPDDISVAWALHGLAAVRFRQGQFAPAESLLKRALALHEREPVPNDRDVAANVSLLSSVYWAQGRYADAEPLMRRALGIRERQQGSDHPDVAGLLSNLGALYWMLGRYDEALAYYERARPILERSLGPRHPTYASILHNIGETYWKLNRLDEAEPLLRRALVLKEEVLAAGHPSIANTLHALAGVLRDARRNGESEQLYRRALEIRTRAFGPENRDVQETLRDYAQLLRNTGRSAEAARLEQRARTRSPSP